MSNRTTAERAAALIRLATGEPYGDGLVVIDLVKGYAEPGYGSDDAVVVFGDWNPKRWIDRNDPGAAPLTREESMPCRLADALTKVGAEVEWYDEWTRCGECYRAMRVVEDSYHWRMYGAFIEGAWEYFCADCLLADLDTSLESYVNNANTCITWCNGADLERAGWEQWEPRNPHTYESGWFSGQTDDPHKVLAEIQRWTRGDEDDDGQDDPHDVVFLLDESSQFYVKFSAYTRAADWEGADDE